MISRFFIDRPIMASVLAIVITLAGVVALLNLPVAQYPDIMPPQITVEAAYPGATAEVVSNNVAAPIELQVNGADNMMYMFSTSSNTGNMTLNVLFKVGTNVELAQVDVQNRVNIALPQLPQAVVDQGIKVQRRSNAFMILVAVYSPDERYDTTYVANYASLYILDELKRVPGASQATIFGATDYAMRIWLKPDRMAELGISAAQVADAIRKQNQQFAVGRLGQPPTKEPVEQTLTVTTRGRLLDPQEFENIILRAAGDGAAIVRLKDVGRAELGARDYSMRRRLNGKPATFIAVYQQPGANALDVSKEIRKTLVELKKSFPEGIDVDIALDITDFVRSSITEVLKTLAEATLLVVLVVFLFLHNVRATIVPILAIPVSIVGTFAGMYLFGFSINLLTLFGLILSIGIVVDDAIVVIENVERNRVQLKLPPREAAIKAMQEVTGPVIAIVLVLCAVFVPVAFLGGISGQLYKQFALTIAISVVISGLMALTLSPAVAAILLKEHTQENRGVLRRLETAFDRATTAYVAGVRRVLRRPVIALVVFALLAAGTWWIFKIVPVAFFPVEDRGYFLAVSYLPDGASLDRTQAVDGQAREVFAQSAAVRYVVEVDGFSLIDGQLKPNAGTMFINLKDYAQRTDPRLEAPAVIAGAMPGLSAIREALVFAFNPPSIPGFGEYRRLRVLDPGPQRGRHRQAGNRNPAVHPKSQEPARAPGPAIDHSRHDPPDLPRRGPREGRNAGGADQRCLRHSADPVRLAVREPVHQVQPALPGHRAGRGRLPHQARGHRPGLRAFARRQDDPLEGPGDPEKRPRPGPGLALQQLPRRPGAGSRRPRLQLRGRREGRRGVGGRGAARRLLLRLERRSLRTEEGRCGVHPGVRLRDRHGLPDPGRSIRTLVPAPGRRPDGALRAFRRHPRHLVEGHRKRHLLPDRPAHADRAGG